jgi:hypothetical protein
MQMFQILILEGNALSLLIHYYCRSFHPTTMLTKVPKQTHQYNPKHEFKIAVKAVTYGQRPRGIEASEV